MKSSKATAQQASFPIHPKTACAVHRAVRARQAVRPVGVARRFPRLLRSTGRTWAALCRIRPKSEDGAADGRRRGPCGMGSHRSGLSSDFRVKIHGAYRTSSPDRSPWRSIVSSRRATPLERKPLAPWYPSGSAPSPFPWLSTGLSNGRCRNAARLTGQA